MKTRRAQFVHWIALLPVLAMLLASCGGGGSEPTRRTPDPLTITTETLPEGTLGQTYSLSMSASGGTLPYTWGLAPGSGSLPPDLSLSSAGTISGHTTANGTYNFTVQVRDYLGWTATRNFTMHVRDPLAILSYSVPHGVVGREFAFSFRATGGLTPYTWTVPSGTLPPGLTLDPSGLLSGTPTTTGYSSFYVRVQDNAQRSAQTHVTMSIDLPLEVVTSSLDDTAVGYDYSASLTATGGYSSYTWGLAPGSGPLPPGLTLSGTRQYYGWITGIPTQAGTYSFVVQVSDQAVPPQIATKALSIYVEDRLYIPPDVLPLGVVGRSYQAFPRVYGGTPPYSWRLVWGVLPSGLTFDPATGEIAGVPEEWVSASSLRLEVTDSSSPPRTASADVVLTINPPVAISEERLPDGVQGKDYGVQVKAVYGIPPYTLRLVAGALPPGLTLKQWPCDYGCYFISGAPTNLGEYGFTVEASDSASPPTMDTADFTIVVVPPLNMLTTSLPEGMTGDFYSATLTAEGGVLPYRWSTGDLPRGLTLDPSSGAISGTPTEAYNQDVYFSVSDSTKPAQMDYRWLRLRVIGRLSVATSRLPAGRPGVRYRVKLAVSGGTAPYTWVLSSGSLPAGLSFNPVTWEISGTPTTEETRTFTVQVTDTGPPVQTASRQLSLTITNSLGRNDTIATATPISNGTFRASISPYADPVPGPAYPDNDYYVLTANPGATVTVETVARRLYPKSPLDSVIEIVDSAGTRFNTCRAGYWFFPCLNDDLSPGSVLDSKLEFRVPGTGAEPATFYVRVLDWRGDARPDFVYDLTISGAN